MIEWSAELRAAVEMALAARPVDIAPYLFCTRRGECYAKADGSANGWESMWGRFMDRLLVETKVVERFTEHGPAGEVREAATPGVSSTPERSSRTPMRGTTERVYRRKPERETAPVRVVNDTVEHL